MQRGTAAMQSHRKSLAVRMHHARQASHPDSFFSAAPQAPSSRGRGRRRGAPMGMAARLRKMEKRKQRSLSVRMERHRRGDSSSSTSSAQSRPTQRPAVGGDDILSIEDLQRSLAEHDAGSEEREAISARRKRLEDRRRRIEELRKSTMQDMMNSSVVDVDDVVPGGASSRARNSLANRLGRFKATKKLVDV